MKILNSNISMSGKSTFTQKQSKQESLNVWGITQDSNSGKNLGLQAKLLELKRDQVKISEEAKKLLAQQKNAVQNVDQEDFLMNQLSDKDKQKIIAIQKMLEMLTGKKVKLIIPKNLNLRSNELKINSSVGQSAANQQPQQLGWGIEYNYHESYSEQQTMSFSSKGTINTADGKEINFSIQLNMSREFYSEKSINFRAGDAAKIDPLVINYNGSVPTLSDQKINFDIDSDGNEEQISFLTQGNGFLALDLDNNGKINNGKELFGPNSGNGFSELSAYDSDSNNWIDENDEIYSKLRIWTKDENGNDVLFALGQKGIGAIYLGNCSTAFDFKDQDNNLKGSVSRTGIFLKESGTAGIIQHIDIAV